MKVNLTADGRIEVKFECRRLLKFIHHISEVNNIATAIYHLAKTGDLENINPLVTDGLPFAFVDEYGHSKATAEQIFNWVFKKAFEDFIVGLTQSLIESYILLRTAALSSSYSSTIHPDVSILQNELDSIPRKAHKLHFPVLIDEIEKMFGGQLSLKEEILSINQVRNYLVHKNGTVTEPPDLTLKFLIMKMKVQKDGQMVELSKDLKTERFRAEKLEAQKEKGFLVFKTGDRLIMTPDIFKDVTYTCILFINELICKLPLPQSLKDEIVKPFTIKLATEYPNAPANTMGHAPNNI